MAIGVATKGITAFMLAGISVGDEGKTGEMLRLMLKRGPNLNSKLKKAPYKSRFLLLRTVASDGR